MLPTRKLESVANERVAPNEKTMNAIVVEVAIVLDKCLLIVVATFRL
jgi:hypothetical protein